LNGARLCRRLCVGSQTEDLRAKATNLPYKYLYFWLLRQKLKNFYNFKGYVNYRFLVNQNM
jgi:hypothetical protein